MKINALTILIGIFMYKNPFDYQIIIGAIIIIIINVYFILKVVKNLLNFYTEKIENAFDEIKMKIKEKLPKLLSKYIHVSNNYIQRIIKAKIIKAIEGYNKKKYLKNKEKLVIRTEKK